MMRMLDFKATYKRQDIVDALRKFRDEHVSGFDVAKDNFRKLRVEKLAEALDLAEAAKVEESKKKVAEVNQMIEPQDMRKEYDNLINLFLYTQDTTVELNSQQADHIFNDNWDWAVSAKFSNSFYSGN